MNSNHRPILCRGAPWLKFSLLFFVLTGSFANAATREDPAALPDPGDYGDFAEELMARENLADCILKMDALIEQGERFAAGETRFDSARALTINGLAFSFSAPISNEAVIYTFVISRGGMDLSFNDATKIAALFGDRAGLTHPIIVTATGKNVFTASWFIKRSKWKPMKAMMLKVRAQNREEKNPQEAFATAVLREIEARKAVEVAHPH